MPKGEATQKYWDSLTEKERKERIKKIGTSLERAQRTELLWKNPEYRKKVMETKPIKNPLSCYFCGELVLLSGHNGDCRVIHSIDGNHENWDPENKVPVHNKCHTCYHWDALSQVKKDVLSRKLSETTRKQWANMTPKDKIDHGRKISEGRRRFFNQRNTGVIGGD